MKASRHILFLQATTKFGGSKRSLLGLIEALQGSSFQPVVAYGKHGWLVEQLDRLQVPHVLLPFFAWRKWLERFRVRPSIHKAWLPALSHWPIALVHSNEFWTAPHAVIAAAALKVPCVVHLRDGHHTLGKARQYRLGQCNSVLAVSTDLREQFAADRTLYEKTMVLFNAHDSCDRVHVNRHQARGQFQFDPEEFVIGNAGRLCERKNQLALLAVLAELRATAGGRRWRLALAGDTEPGYLEALQAATKTRGLEGAVSFLGAVPDMPGFYAAIDMLVHCAHREGLPRVIPEAMFCRRPVVATAAEGIRDCIPDDSFGAVVAPGDPVALAKAIIAIAENEVVQEAVIERAYQRARSLFTRHVQQERLIQIYEGLVGLRRPTVGVDMRRL